MHTASLNYARIVHPRLLEQVTISMRAIRRRSHECECCFTYQAPESRMKSQNHVFAITTSAPKMTTRPKGIVMRLSYQKLVRSGFLSP